MARARSRRAGPPVVRASPCPRGSAPTRPGARTTSPQEAGPAARLRSSKPAARRRALRASARATFSARWCMRPQNGASSPLRLFGLLDRRQNLLQAQILEQGFPFLGVVSISRGELAEEAKGCHDPQLSCQELDGLLRDFIERLCLDVHSVSSAISSR